VAEPRAARMPLTDPRPLVVADERNPGTAVWREALAKIEAASPDSANCIVAIGGDGTIHHAIQQHWRRRLPFFGINAGHLGFLLNDPKLLCDGTLPKEVICRPTPLLFVEMQKPDGSWTQHLTFNDAWIERSTGQTAWLKVTVDANERIEKLVCDGALVSTAAGSTAYARSMGAQPLLVDTPAWLIVGSNVIKPINWKAAMLSLDSRVEVLNLDPDKRPLNGYVHGDYVGPVLGMRARPSRIAAVELAFCPEHDITEKIAMIQFPTKGDPLPGL